MCKWQRKHQTNPILKRFRAGLDAIYGSQLERVVLYGSHARGDAHPESDYAGRGRSSKKRCRSFYRRFAEHDFEAGPMTAIVLRRTDAEKNMARFYRLDVQPNLFGSWSFIPEWGRIGRLGQARQPLRPRWSATPVLSYAVAI
jgi:WGR domain